MEMNTLTQTKCLNLKAQSLAPLQLNICMRTLTPGTKDDVKALYTMCNQYAWKVRDDISSRPEDLATHHEFVLIINLGNAVVLTCKNFWYSVYALSIYPSAGEKMNGISVLQNHDLNIRMLK
jgi:hypothetical protein